MNICRSKLSVIRQIIRKNSTINLPKEVLKCGQPTSVTHPHLLKDGEILPHIKAAEFQSRRQKLVELITYYSKTNNNNNPHIIVIPSATKRYMSDKIPYVFRQNSDYLYLSGSLEPDSCLVLYTTPDSNNHTSILFVKNSDAYTELWDGPSTSVVSAPTLFGVDKALPMNDLKSFVDSYLSSNKNCNVWYDPRDKVQPFVDQIMVNTFGCTAVVCVRKDSLKKFIHQLRLIKSPAEIELMKKSCDISAEAFKKTIAASKPGITEHQLFATVDYECRMRGAEYLAYPPVVAGGERATTIHYINNNQVIKNGEMVLMDAGCELHGYCSDITRTWPINGVFSKEQKLLYEVIFDVQRELFKLVALFPTLDHLFDSMIALLGKRLQEIGLISKKETQTYKSAYSYCPHHVSHYLGMDVHDTSTIGRNIRLQPGMIITIEPGIYISSKNPSIKAPPEFRGLGIRIEDDVLITENGPVILSEKTPKDIQTIEKLASSATTSTEKPIAIPKPVEKTIDPCNATKPTSN